jgi:hypothetical protein
MLICLRCVNEGRPGVLAVDEEVGREAEGLCLDHALQMLTELGRRFAEPVAAA